MGGDPAELMRICVENGTFTVSFLREGLTKVCDTAVFKRTPLIRAISSAAGSTTCSSLPWKRVKVRMCLLRAQVLWVVSTLRRHYGYPISERSQCPGPVPAPTRTLSQSQTARQVFPMAPWVGINLFGRQMGGSYNYLVRSWRSIQVL